MTNPVYRTRAWREVAAFVLARDGFVCRIALAGCGGRADSVDHVIELVDGGAAFDPGNLQAACAACNSSKHNRRRAELAREARAGALRRW
jgi:5-methylcytosine-specific restriction endonuclease McrA